MMKETLSKASLLTAMGAACNIGRHFIYIINRHNSNLTSKTTNNKHVITLRFLGYIVGVWC